MSYKDNAFRLVKGNVNLTSGTYVANDDIIFLCAVDGSLLVTWDDDTSDTINTLAGEPYIFENAKTVQIVSGTFHKK